MHSLKLTFLVVFMVFGHSFAMTDKELREDFTKKLLSCTQEYPVEMVDLLPLKQLVVPTKPEVKCLLACSYKKYGSMDSKGMYDIQKSHELAELVKNGTPKDEERLANAKKLVELCKKVNDEPVTDGEKGCDRAALMFKCAVEHAPKLGFKLA